MGFIITESCLTQGKEKLVMSPALREQTRKYKEMFEAMYLKQKANNSFFTGDTHVLDLTSRSVVAQSLQNVVQQQQEVVPTREEVPTTSSEVRKSEEMRENYGSRGKM